MHQDRATYIFENLGDCCTPIEDKIEAIKAALKTEGRYSKKQFVRALSWLIDRTEAVIEENDLLFHQVQSIEDEYIELGKRYERELEDLEKHGFLKPL